MDGKLTETARSHDSLSQEAGARDLILAASFSTDPLEAPLRFWIDTLGAPLTLRSAPYGQVLQQILDPASDFASNTRGINLLLLRIEDCVRDMPADTPEAVRIDRMKQGLLEWMHGLDSLRQRGGGSLIVFCAPPSQSSMNVSRAQLEAVHERLIREIKARKDIILLQHSDVMQLYPVESHEDGEADQLAHIPHTPEYTAALATLLMRKVIRLSTPPHKVIAIDCDNTLWTGVCAEANPRDLEITVGHFAFHRMLVSLHDAGVLLCLCSKNSWPDVEAVFSARPEMPLQLRHLVSHRINWESKSANLHSLAAELNLGLDSFIFIDDNPLECAEVSAHCPEVLTLQLPLQAHSLHNFLHHTWAFDAPVATADGAKRNVRYKENALRAAAARDTSGDFSEFLATLGLEVEVLPLQPEHLDRVAELVVRTNQFNLTTIRRSPGEIVALTRDNRYHAKIITVSDRFGSYGLTGVVFLQSQESVADVDTFLLSCRVLGRGVEARVVNQLGRLASDLGLQYLQFNYNKTQRNAPALSFLRKTFAQFEEVTASRHVYTVPVSFAIGLAVEQCAANAKQNDNSTFDVEVEPVKKADSWHHKTQTLNRVTDIVQEIERHRRLHSGAHKGPRRIRGGETDNAVPQAPSGPIETLLAEIWCDLLGQASISRTDGFIELGGDSVLLVRLISKITNRLRVRPSIAAMLRCQSLAAMAQLIIALSPTDRTPECVELEEGSI